MTDFNETSLSEAEAYWRRGKVHVESGKYRKALNAYNKAIILRPDDSVFYFDRGMLYEKIHFQTSTDRKDAFRRLYQGNNFRSTWIKKAFADYTKAVTVDFQNIDSYYQRGKLHIKYGEYDAALADYHQAIALRPNRSRLYKERGDIYSEMGRVDEALSDYAQSVELDPSNFGAYIGSIYLLYGYRIEAKETLLWNCKKAISLVKKLNESEIMRDYDRFSLMENRRLNHRKNLRHNTVKYFNSKGNKGFNWVTTNNLSKEDWKDFFKKAREIKDKYIGGISRRALMGLAAKGIRTGEVDVDFIYSLFTAYTAEEGYCKVKSDMDYIEYLHMLITSVRAGIIPRGKMHPGFPE